MVSCICAVENKKNKQMKKILLLFALGVFSMALHAQNGPKISVQGKLNDVDGLPLADGDQELIFRLYHQPTGGTAIWADTAMVEIRGGVYSYNLGSGNPLIPAQFDSTVYVGVVVDGVEISPRTELTYAPYTLGTNFAARTDTVAYARGSANISGGGLEVEEDLRIIRGIIFSNGIKFGDGFTAAFANPPTGRYLITFNEPFSGLPTAVVHGWDIHSDACRTVTIGNVTTTSLEVYQWRCDGWATYDDVHVTIIGPK